MSTTTITPPPAAAQSASAEAQPKPEQQNQPAPAAAENPTGGSPVIEQFLGRDKLFKSLTGQKPKEAKEKKEEAPPAEVPAADPAPSGNPAPEAVKKPEKAEKETRPPKHVDIRREQLTAAEIAEAARAGSVAAARDLAAQKPAAPAPTDLQVPEIFAEDEQMFRQLEKLDPKKYGGGKLAKSLAQSAKQIADYEKAWRDANPGQKYDPEDHADELEGFLPDISDKERIRALTAIAVEEQLRPVRESETQRTKRAEAEGLVRSIAPVVESASQALTKKLIDSSDQEMISKLNAGDATAAEDYADHLEVLRGHLGQWKPAIERATVLLHGGEKVYNPGDQLDQFIVANLFPAIEAHYSGSDAPGGRTYISRAEFEAMPPERRRRHATITPDMVISGAVELAGQEYVKAKNSLAEREKMYAKRFGVNRQAPKSGHTPTPAEVNKTQSPSASRPSGVGVPSGAPTVGSKPGAPSGAQTARDNFFRSAVQA